MEASINAKVERFIRAFVGGNMGQKEATINKIKEQLREDNTAWSRMVGLSFEEENYLLFSSLDFDYSSQSQVERLIIDMGQGLWDGRLNSKYKVRYCYYAFNQIDFSNNEWCMVYEDEVPAIINRFKESVLDAFEFANKNPKLAKAGLEDALSCLEKIKEMVFPDEEGLCADDEYWYEEDDSEC